MVHYIIGSIEEGPTQDTRLRFSSKTGGIDPVVARPLVENGNVQQKPISQFS